MVQSKDARALVLVHNSDITALKELPRNSCEALAHSSGHKKGLRAVAVLEAVKGLLAIAASFVFLEIVHKNVDLEDAAQNLLYYLHIDPDRRLSQAFVHAASKVMDANVTLVLVIAFVYATGRFIEGYGLWETARLGRVAGDNLGRSVSALRTVQTHPPS